MIITGRNIPVDVIAGQLMLAGVISTHPGAVRNELNDVHALQEVLVI